MKTLLNLLAMACLLGTVGSVAEARRLGQVLGLGVSPLQMYHTELLGLGCFLGFLLCLVGIGILSALERLQRTIEMQDPITRALQTPAPVEP